MPLPIYVCLVYRAARDFHHSGRKYKVRFDINVNTQMDFTFTSGRVHLIFRFALVFPDFGVFRDRRKSSIPTPSPPSSKTLESKVANSDGGDAIFVVFDNMISTEVFSRTRRQQGVDQHRHGRSCTGVEQSGSGGGLLVLILDSLVFVLASRPVGTYVGASAMYVFNGFPNAQGARRGKEARSGNS